MCYSHRLEGYSGIKRNEALAPGTTWMTLENMMQSESTQSPETTHGVILLI